MSWSDYEGKEFLESINPSASARTSDARKLRFHAHSWTYKTSGSSITARCKTGCPEGYDTNGFTLTLNAPENLAWDGNPKEASLTGTYPNPRPAGLAKKPTVEYGKKSYGFSYLPIDYIPVEIGDYRARIT